MTRILVIITTGFSQYGGLASVMMNYLRYIDYTGIKIDILSGNEPEKELLAECHSLGIDYLRISGRNNNPVKYMLSLKRILMNYDVIHINANSATAAVELFAAKLADVSNRIVHNHTAQCNHILLHKLLKPIYQRLYTDAIACSCKAGDWIYGKDNYFILKNSIDSEKYKFDQEKRKYIRSEYGITENAFVVGHVGKIYRPKNHRRLLEIFKQVYKNKRDSYLLLVGDGDMRTEIEEYSRRLGVDKNVIFAGMKKNTYDYLSAMDCFLFPSLWEGMPLALLEAQASGLFCIVSDVIDKEAVMCENVWINSLEDTNEKWCADVLRAVEYDREDTSNHNLKRIFENNYDVKKNANKLRELYMK